MVNNSIIVGRISNLGGVIETQDKKVFSYLTVAIPRNYKNKDGVYETDFVDCVLNGSIATNTVEYCRVGDTVGIKGRLENEYDDSSNPKTKVLRLIVEKITFLSSKKSKED